MYDYEIQTIKFATQRRIKIFKNNMWKKVYVICSIMMRQINGKKNSIENFKRKKMDTSRKKISKRSRSTELEE